MEGGREGGREGSNDRLTVLCVRRAGYYKRTRET